MSAGLPIACKTGVPCKRVLCCQQHPLPARHPTQCCCCCFQTSLLACFCTSHYVTLDIMTCRIQMCHIPARMRQHIPPHYSVVMPSGIMPALSSLSSIALGGTLIGSAPPPFNVSPQHLMPYNLNPAPQTHPDPPHLTPMRHCCCSWPPPPARNPHAPLGMSRLNGGISHLETKAEITACSQRPSWRSGALG